MSHTADIARGHEIRAAEESPTQKAVSHVPPGEGARSLWVFNEFVTHKIPSHRTGGAYAHFEVATRPGAGPPAHIHHREDEAFYVLEGEFEFLAGEETLRVGAGFLLYLPKGTLHAHRAIGEGVGRMLVTQTPGGLYERFFEEVGQGASRNVATASLDAGSPEAVRIAEVAARYGIEIAPPADGRPRDGRPNHSARPIRDPD
jgi:mannose-6-phosphate isomerase-like protein (cupin superfamily)